MVLHGELRPAPSVPVKSFAAGLGTGVVQRRLLLSICGLLTLAFLAALPLAGRALAPIPNFFPAFAAFIAVADLITAILLLSKARTNGVPALAMLAAGYVFCALMSLGQLLTFPGAHGAERLFSADAATPAWLWVFSHCGFPVFVVAYFLLRRFVPAGDADADARIRRMVWASPAYAAAAALVFWELAIPSIGHLPWIALFGPEQALFRAGVGPALLTFNGIAVAAFLVRRDRSSMIETWLGVAVLAAVFEVALALLAVETYTVGWYLSLANALFGSVALLAALAFEFGRLLREERASRERETLQKRETARLRFLSMAGQLLAQTLDLDDMLALLAKHATLELGERCAVLAFDEGGRCAVGVASADADAARDSAVSLRRGNRAQALVELEAEEAVALQQTQLASTRWGEHTLIVPIVVADKSIGVITCGRSGSADYLEPEIALAEELAARIGLAVLNARSYGRERRLADALQRAMLPTVLPQLAGVVFDAVHVAGDAGADIGGDWYDAFALPDSRAIFSIGDVAGRGLAAAIVMSKVRQAIRAFALTDPDPRTIVKNVDRMLRLDGSLGVSAIVGVVDPESSSLTFVNAGHPGPLVISEDKVELIEQPRTLPLGMIEHEEVKACTLQLVPSQLLVFYTDGLIESDRNIEANERRLRDVAMQVYDAKSSRPTDEIRRKMISGPPSDDVAILTLVVPASPRSALDVQLPATAESARALRHAVRRIALEAGLESERLLALEVAVGEAIANVMEHAYGASSGDVRLRAYRTIKEISIEIIDFGHWRAERSEGRGHGINLMRTLCPSVEIVRNGRTTSVRFSETVST
jgi:anti-sigma regulatory factor (Ser/Thr protein kinase)